MGLATLIRPADSVDVVWVSCRLRFLMVSSFCLSSLSRQEMVSRVVVLDGKLRTRCSNSREKEYQ